MKTRPLHSTVAALVALALVGGAFTAGVAGALMVHREHVRATARTLPPFPQAIALDPEALTAKAAILYDPTDNRVLFAKNATAVLPLASLTKLLTSETILSQQEPTTTVTITAADIAPEGDWGLRPGDTLSLHDLLKMSLIASSNDAITAAATSLGNNYLSQMNRMAQKLGLTGARFYNPSGLDVNSEVSGGYASALDVARLAAIFMHDHPKYFEMTQQAGVSVDDGGRTLTAAATAAPLLSMPGFVGAKTGYTDLAGGNLVAAFDIEIGHPLVAVVLGSTEQGRFEDIKTLITAVRQTNN